MIDQYTKFACLYEMLNFTKAAQKLNITQPTLSIAIKNLEDSLSTKLFIRSKKGLQTTRKADELYIFVKKILYEDANLHRLFNSKHSSQLKIGIIDNVAITFAKPLKKFIDEKPEWSCQLVIDNSGKLISMLNKDYINIAILTQNPYITDSNFVVKKIHSEKFHLVFSSKFSSLKKILSEFIAYNEDSNTYGLIKNKLEALNYKSRIVAYSASPNAILEFTKEGLGFSVLPENVIKKDLKLGNLKIYNKFKLERGIYLIYKRSLYLSHVEKAFLNHVQNIF